MSEQPTVRVRIAVAVDEHGKWIASGTAGAVDRHVGERASASLRRVSKAMVTVHWIEADVPLPYVPLPLPPLTILGTVTPAEEGRAMDTVKHLFDERANLREENDRLRELLAIARNALRSAGRALSPYLPESSAIALDEFHRSDPDATAAEEEAGVSCIDCGYDPCECEVGYGPIGGPDAD